MDAYLAGLATESVSETTRDIDLCSTQEMVEMMNREDARVAEAVHAECGHIAQAVDLIYGCLRRGGRLIYLGAGTSGRLGVLDASECPPTFGVDPAMVQGFIAGGDRALRHAVEGCEDSAEDGERLIDELAVGADDAVVGITASGSATYVLADAIERAGSADPQAVRDALAATDGLVLPEGSYKCDENGNLLHGCVIAQIRDKVPTMVEYVDLAA